MDILEISRRPLTTCLIWSVFYYFVLALREALQKKNEFVMEIFRKGSDPPPLFLEVMEPVRHISILVTKKGKNKTSQKHPKWPYLI